MINSIKNLNFIFGIVFLLFSFSVVVHGNENPREDSLMIMNLCSSAIEDTTDFAKSMGYLDHAKSIASKSDCNSCLAEVYYTMGVINQSYDQTDSAIANFNIAISLFEKIHNDYRCLEIVQSVSNLLGSKYEFTKSIEYIKKGLEIGDSLKNQILRAELYLEMGSRYDDLGLYQNSTESLIHALSLFEKENDSSGICSSLISLGSTFLIDENYSDAFEYTEQALEIAYVLDDSYSISACLNNIGNIYSYTGEIEKALEYFSRSLEIDRELGDKLGIAICLNNIGDSHKVLGDTVLALSYYNQGIEVALPDNYYILSVLYSNLAEVNMAQGNLKEALRLANEGLAQAFKASSTDDIIFSYDLIHRIYAEMGRYEDAYDYLLELEKLNDSTYSLSKTQSIQDIKAKYNYTKQRTEISSLREKSINEKVTRRYLIAAVAAVTILIISMFVINSVIRRSRKLLRKQKLYYEKLLEHSEDYVTVVDGSGIIKYVSPSYERRLGRSPESRIGSSTFEFVHNDDVEHVKQEFAGLLKDKKPRNTTFRIKDHTDSWIIVYAFGQNLLDDPTIEGVVINFWDITQIKKNEEIISQSEVKFREIFNAFPDIYFQTDVGGVITEVSPSVEGLIGYTREELIGISSFEYYHFIADWKIIAARLESNNKISDHDTQIKTKSGKVIYCSFSAEFIYDSSGKRIGAKGLIRDISSRIKNQKKLSDSQAKLREANKAKEMIFSIIAHDLIGPIGTNKSIVDLIVSQVDDLTHEEIVSLITSLKPSLDSTYSLIENLLSWSRIQQNRIVPNYENIAVSKVLNPVLNIFNSQAKAKSVEIEITGNTDIKVLADQNQLDIIFRNLISNAIKFSYKNSKVIIDVVQKKKVVVINVTDSGVGMTPQIIKKILSGKGVEKSRKGTDNEKGTGFGLVIVNEFVRNNKGKMEIKSKEGDGTKFTITLPVGS